MFPRFKSILYLRIARNYFRTFLSLVWLPKLNRIFRSFESSRVFRVSYCSIFKIPLWSFDPLFLTAFLLYHVARPLSRGFLNFFKVFFAPDPWYRLPLKAAYLVYHISFALSSTFSKFLFLLSGRVVFQALLATFLFYHINDRLSTQNFAQCI